MTKAICTQKDRTLGFFNGEIIMLPYQQKGEKVTNKVILELNRGQVGNLEEQKNPYKAL